MTLPPPPVLPIDSRAATGILCASPIIHLQSIFQIAALRPYQLNLAAPHKWSRGGKGCTSRYWIAQAVANLPDPMHSGCADAHWVRLCRGIEYTFPRINRAVTERWESVHFRRGHLASRQMTARAVDSYTRLRPRAITCPQPSVMADPMGTDPAQ